MKVLTFDIEDWFHILDNDSTRTEAEWINYPTRIHESVNRILDLLAENNAKATFFCLGWVGEHYPDVIKKIDSLGHEIGSHSYSHQLIYDQSYKEIFQDIKRSVDVLQNITGKKVKAYRAPGFSITQKTPWIIDILQQCGIEYDCSISTARHSHGGECSFPDTGPQYVSYRGSVIKEFPLNAWDIHGLKVLYSGGGYFRLFPYWVIKRLIQRSDYVMSYFHPRDFDPGQPMIPNLSIARQFKSYYGLSTSFKKLKKLLHDHEYSCVSDASDKIDWDSAPVLELGDRRRRERKMGSKFEYITRSHHVSPLHMNIINSKLLNSCSRI